MTCNEKFEILKNQVKNLKEKLKMTNDDDMRHKINKLSYLIGDAMAKKKNNRKSY